MSSFGIPLTINAGSKLEFTESNNDFPASAGWVLKYILINSKDKISINSTADGDSHKVLLSSAQTANYNAGTYTFQRYFENGAEVDGILTGTLIINPNLITAATYDTRTVAKKILDAIQATIQRRATKEQSSISVMGKSLTNMSFDELIKAESHYLSVVQNEEALESQKQGKKGKQKILLEFRKH